MSLPLRLAIRDLRGGLTGLRLLAVCLFLGVAALAGVGSLSSAIVGGIAGEGQRILGGDIEVRVSQREASQEELQFLQDFRIAMDLDRLVAGAIERAAKARYQVI